MLIYRNNLELQNETLKLKKTGKSIGFVATMGALHQGHISLIEQARKENDIVIVSVFVNPLQFGPKEDFSKYPRPRESDENICKDHNVDILFLPEEDSFYLKDHKTYVTVEGLSEIHCGKTRPGHFKGVTTVVLKLFNIVEPDRAYFGKKDFQQLVIIKKMVADLSLPIEVIGCPIVRDFDGIALSSRNKYLSPEERKTALAISQSLREAANRIASGEKSAKVVYDLIFEKLSNKENLKIDYIAIVDDYNLKTRENLDKNTVILIAAYVGSTRLIDNLHLEDIL